MEAVRTNVLGTENVLERGDRGRRRSGSSCLSTDKAVYPINAMGISKAMMEKVMVAKSRSRGRPAPSSAARATATSWPSRGSVIPLFVEQIQAGQPLTVTDPAMTRFMMTLDDAVDLVLYAFEHGNNGDIFVQKAPAATVADSGAGACSSCCGKPEHPVQVIGTRHGEKLYETLLTREEMAGAEDLGDYYRVPPDSRDLNYAKFFEQGEPRISAGRGLQLAQHHAARRGGHEGDCC